jgi:uncharacterized protein
MSAGKRLTYVDSSALLKLAIHESGSDAIRRYVVRRALVSSSLARTEVGRALLSLGADGARRARGVLSRVELIRVSDRILESAAALPPKELRALDAIHLATAAQLESDLGAFVTYDDRQASAAEAHGFRVAQPR